MATWFGATCTGIRVGSIISIHVNGLQDGRRVVLRPSDIVRTPFIVVARHHRQSVSVGCFSCDSKLIL